MGVPLEPIAVAVPARMNRRKERTRAALVKAAREILAARGSSDVSIQEITDTADVGFGSFYNHFQSKDELFTAAVAEALDEHGAMIDDLTSDLRDPAEIFAVGVRSTGRLQRQHPEMAKIVIHAGGTYLMAEHGLAPRALRDIKSAKAAGRFDIGSPELAVAMAAGSLIAMMHFADALQPKRLGEIADELAFNLLRMFGLSREEAHEVVSRPLPRRKSGD